VRSPAEMQTIQIEFTSACVLKCSNCTRFCGTHKVPFFLEWDLFTAAIDSLVPWIEQWPQGIVGAMGGEPLLHPKFREMCEYMLSRIPRERLGLWSVFPDAPKYLAYRDVVSKTFGNILLNDHSREDILHAPILVASEEVIRKQCPRCVGEGTILNQQTADPLPCTVCSGKGTVPDEEEIFLRTERCWIQESWSAAVNPKGAWFCEVAAALSDLFDGPMGWDVKGNWWKKTPKDFKEQREWACRKCGAALPLARRRNSQNPADDVSPDNLERLKAVGSKKVKRGEFVIMDQPVWDDEWKQNHGYPVQTYKDFDYRQGIAKRYGIVLTMNQRGYWEPHLEEEMPTMPPPQPSLFQTLSEQYQ